MDVGVSVEAWFRSPLLSSQELNRVNFIVIQTRGILVQLALLQSVHRPAT